MKLVTACAMSAFLAALVGPSSAEPVPQTAESIRSQLIGNTDVGVNPANGLETYIYFAPDGTLSGLSDGRYRSKGSYEINPDGTLCTHWKDPKWDGSCTKRYPQADGGFHAIDDRGHVKFNVKATLPGNPQNL